MGTNKNKATRQNSNRKIVGAIQKHLRGPVTLEGVKYTPSSLAKVFQNGIDVADATDAANKAWHVAVATEQKTLETLSSVEAQLRNHVAAAFGQTSTEFSDFGFAPRAVREVDADTKAAAVKKRAATRAARHTMGKRQRLEVTGETSPATPSPTTLATPAAPSVPAPAKTIATS